MGIFDSEVDVFARYKARIRMRDRLFGGTPKDPKLIEGWLRSKAGISDKAELMEATRRTLIELGVEVPADATFDDLVKASEELAATKQTNGFKLDPEKGLYIESRQVKAMIKENTNILFAGEKWGRTRKGPKNFVAERVFVNPDQLYLGRMEPDGIETIVGTVSGPQGPRSVVGYHEYVEQVPIEFEVIVAEDAVTEEQWAQIWVLAQENGLGAIRAQGYGRFDIEQWERS